MTRPRRITPVVLLLLAAAMLPLDHAHAQGGGTVILPPSTPLPPGVGCDDLLASEEGVLFGPTGTGGDSPCTFPDKLPGDGGGSFDPNDKLGAPGAGAGRFLTGGEPLRYVINFENLASATAPAQEIFVTDQLDAAKLDLSTFSLGPISFSATTVVPPPGLSAYTTDVDLRPGTNAIARVTASLNATTGLLTWSLVAVDPVTGELPEDVRVGLLPPNVNAPEGQGSVLFTVAPKPTLVTGDVICNRARIVFDVNAPIDTPEFCNAFDKTKPASQVAALAATQSATAFLVQWAGTDAGAGVQEYDVFVSDNGGGFVPFVTKTAATSATFTGQAGRTYAFYSIARDLVGNVEDPPAVADATTVVRLNQAPTANAGGDRTVRLGSLVTLAGSGTDPDGGPSALTFVWTQTGGPAVTLTAATTAGPTFTPGLAATYTFALTVSDGAATSAPDSVSIKVPPRGDVDLDGDVDSNDTNLIVAARNTPASGPNDLRDLNGDGRIDALDARIHTTLCTRPRCATQ